MDTEKEYWDVKAEIEANNPNLPYLEVVRMAKIVLQQRQLEKNYTPAQRKKRLQNLVAVQKCV